MKSSLTALIASVLVLTSSAADNDKHAKGGPTGGRVITGVKPHVEFLVNKDRKIEIRFIGDDNKVVPPDTQTVSVVMGDRSAPTKLFFARDGNKLISDRVIPEGDDLPTVVQIRSQEGAKAVNAKFNLNLSKCPTCDYKEYACICAHGEEKE